MKKIYKDKILNINGTNLFDNKFLFTYLNVNYKNNNIEVFDMGKFLKEKENTNLLNNLGDKYAAFANIYSEQDEFEIFKNLFNYAINNNKKIHILGITLDLEIELLERYYKELGFLREDVNCFVVDFSKVLVSVSVNIENLIWRGSDYKKMKNQIFFIPPIREAGLTKSMFKGINRGSIAGINIKKFNDENINFLNKCLKEEHILPMTMSKVLNYNLLDIGFLGESEYFEFLFS